MYNTLKYKICVNRFCYQLYFNSRLLNSGGVQSYTRIWLCRGQPLTPVLFQGQLYFLIPLLWSASRGVKFIDTGNRMLDARGWGKGKMRSYHLIGIVCFPRWKSSKISCRMWKYLFWTVHLKMVKVVNLILCVLYHNLKIRGKVQGFKNFTKFTIVFPVHVQDSSMFKYNNLLSFEKVSRSQ